MIFKDMYSRVQFTLGLEDSLPTDELTLAKAFVNEGVVDVLTRTRPHTRCIDLHMAANTPLYDMSNQILWLLDLQEVGSWKFLDRMSREDIVYAQQYGNPGFAYEEPLLWISPLQSTATDFNAYGGFRPTPLSADSDDCSRDPWGGLAPEFHPAVVNYALWKGGEYLQHEQSGGGERWRTLYEGQDGAGGDISRIKKILGKRVTPKGASRRALERNLGGLSRSGSYMGG
jgi:hypothetical protein